MTGKPSTPTPPSRASHPFGFIGLKAALCALVTLMMLMVGACTAADEETATGPDGSAGEGAKLATSITTPADSDVAAPKRSENRRKPHSEGRAEDEPKPPTPKKLTAYQQAMVEGDGALYSGRLEAARRHYFRAMELRPKAMSPALGALRALRTRGRGEERAGVIRTIKKKIAALKKAPETLGAAHLLQARMAIALEKPGVAMDAATLAVELLPELGVARRIRGEAAMVAEDWSVAVAALKRAAELGLEAKAGTWERMAFAQDELGHLESAEASARRAVRLTGADPHAQRRRLNMLAVILKRRGDLTAADGVLERALKLGPKDPMVLHNAGALAEAKGLTDQALEAYGAALKQAPLPMTYWRRGKLLLQLDRHAPALSDFKAAAARPERWTWPSSTAFWPALDAGKLYARAGKYKAALGWFDDAIRAAVNPEDLAEIRSWAVYTRSERRLNRRK